MDASSCMHATQCHVLWMEKACCTSLSAVMGALLSAQLYLQHSLQPSWCLMCGSAHKDMTVIAHTYLRRRFSACEVETLL